MIILNRTTRSLVVLASFITLQGAVGPFVGAQSSPPQRRSRLATLLEQGKVAFGLNVNFGGVGDSPMDAMTHASNSDIDLVMYDMEHNPFDVRALRTYMQFLLDPGSIAKTGDVLTLTSVLVRIPAYGRELDKNTWQVKSVLDSGAHGVVFPHIETPDQALTAVRAMRYPPKPGAPNFEPDGIRGSGNMVAARYWGLSPRDYEERAGIWKLDAQGTLIPWFIIENKLGVEDVRDICRQLKTRNIGAVLWAGSGDLMASYNNDQKAVALAVDAILAAGKEFGIPVALNGSANVKERMAQGARIFMGGATAEARKQAGR